MGAIYCPNLPTIADIGDKYGPRPSAITLLESQAPSSGG